MVCLILSTTSCEKQSISEAKLTDYNGKTFEKTMVAYWDYLRAYEEVERYSYRWKEGWDNNCDWSAELMADGFEAVTFTVTDTTIWGGTRTLNFYMGLEKKTNKLTVMDMFVNNDGDTITYDTLESVQIVAEIFDEFN